MRRSIAIVGGGAAGIYAALGARREGASTTIYERNARLGIKILISGGGKCNITHDAPPRDIEKGFVRQEARFLRHSLHELTSGDVLSALHDQGLETYTRDNGRVFPTSGRAEDVLDAFERMLDTNGVITRVNARVTGVEVADGCVVGVSIDGEVVKHDAVIVATGGMSYSKVGTTGDGISWARSLGHSIAPVRAALAPIYFPVAPASDWQGVSLRDVSLTVGARDAAAIIERMGVPLEWRADVLLTHRGVSGPATLEISRAAALAREHGVAADLIIDLVPDSDIAALQQLWEARLTQSSRGEIQSFVEQFVPRALGGYILDAAGLQPGRRMSDIDRKSRTALLSTLKHWIVGVVGDVPLERGEVTAGGIALDEVDRLTMESKRISGLYLAGEALDVAGSVGGYNLQAAFSTGWVAGSAAARRIA